MVILAEIMNLLILSMLLWSISLNIISSLRWNASLINYVDDEMQVYLMSIFRYLMWLNAKSVF